MSLKRFLKSAGVGIAVALLVLVIGVAGEIEWFALGLPEMPWMAVFFVSSVILSGVGLVMGFWWQSGKAPGAFTTTMLHLRRYLTSLAIGLGAAAVVILGGRGFGVGPHVTHSWILSMRPIPPALLSGVSRTASQNMLVCEHVTHFIAPPWYVSTLAGLALVTASGWQLRRSWRGRRASP